MADGSVGAVGGSSSGGGGRGNCEGREGKQAEEETEAEKAKRHSSPQKAEERDEEVELFGEGKDELMKILEDESGPAVVAEAKAIVKPEEEEQAQEEKEAEKAEEEREAEVRLYCSGNPRDISVELRKLSGLSCMSTQELERMIV